MQEIKSRGLTRDAIKMIAMLTMFFNHFSHVFLTAGTYPAEFLKGIGYFTAPVMCYFLVEGFYKTSSRRAYAKRLFVFALVSQVPYFLAFNREAAVLNMMFSLLPVKFCQTLSLLFTFSRHLKEMRKMLLSLKL